MGSNFFTRENEEEKIHKRAILDNSKKFILMGFWMFTYNWNSHKCNSFWWFNFIY
jgi:hypothetical protein